MTFPHVKSSLRVVVLCCDGLYQRHLIHRAAAEFDLVGVVLQQPRHESRHPLQRLAPYRDPRRLWRQLQSRLSLPRHERRGDQLRRQLFYRDGQYPEIPVTVPRLETTSINGPETVAFLRDHPADIVLVNGTQLLRDPILELLPTLRHGIINLHTGLSPYSRGANCNLYMILEGHPELVGVTVHHIDRGIDSGDIILSAQVPYEPEDNFETVDVRSFALGIDLLIEAAHRLEAGSAERVPQWEQGKLFLRRTGYVYEPHQRLLANRRIEQGLLRQHLGQAAGSDPSVRLVGSPEAPCAS